MERIQNMATLPPLFDNKGTLNPEAVQLIRQAYPSLENPKDCLYCAKNQETVLDILAEQAVLDNNMDFFHKILEQGENTLYGNDYFFTAVAQTGHFEFVNELLKADEDYRLYNFFERKTKDRALATISSLEFISLPADATYGSHIADVACGIKGPSPSDRADRHLFTVEKQFEMTFFSCGIGKYDIGVALAFLEKGITQKQILKRACPETKLVLKKLFEEDV